MTFAEIMQFLEEHENPDAKKVLMRHGARDPFCGVRIGDLKKVMKKVEKNHELPMRLYATGNADAMYLAGLIAEETRTSKQDLRDWVKDACWYMLSESGEKTCQCTLLKDGLSAAESPRTPGAARVRVIRQRPAGNPCTFRDTHRPF